LAIPAAESKEATATPKISGPRSVVVPITTIGTLEVLASIRTGKSFFGSENVRDSVGANENFNPYGDLPDT
jgi:hypothetical protein